MQCPPPSPELGASPPSRLQPSPPRMCLSPLPMSSTSSSRKRCAQTREEDISKGTYISGESVPSVSFEEFSKPIGKEDSERTKKRRLTAPRENPVKRAARRLNLGRYSRPHHRNPVQAVETISRFARMQFSPESAKSICSTITRKLWQSSLTSSPVSADTQYSKTLCAQCDNFFHAKAGKQICTICYLENQMEERYTGDGSEQGTSESRSLLSTISQMRRSLSLMESILTSITLTEASELSFWIGHVNVSINSLTDCLNRLRTGTSSPLSTKPLPSDLSPRTLSYSPTSRPSNPLCQQIDGM
jgi:RNase P subunit RPR2